MLFTGKLVDGARAAAIGLAHEAVAAEEVLASAMSCARAVAACAPEAVRLMKRSLYDGAGWDPRSAARAEAFAQAATMRTEDAREGIRALLEKREPRFGGT
jgi:enoyl-CoA hydratase